MRNPGGPCREGVLRLKCQEGHPHVAVISVIWKYMRKVWVSVNFYLFVCREFTVCIQCQNYQKGILWLGFEDGLENSCSKEDLTNFPSLYAWHEIRVPVTFAICWGLEAGDIHQNRLALTTGIRANPEPTSCENVRISTDSPSIQKRGKDVAQMEANNILKWWLNTSDIYIYIYIYILYMQNGDKDAIITGSFRQEDKEGASNWFH